MKLQHNGPPISVVLRYRAGTQPRRVATRRNAPQQTRPSELDEDDLEATNGGQGTYDYLPACWAADWS